MKKSETEKSVGDKLKAPVQLTPEQLENVAAGVAAELPKGKIKTATTGETATPNPKLI
jgi:hypothetical protein